MSVSNDHSTSSRLFSEPVPTSTGELSVTIAQEFVVGAGGEGAAEVVAREDNILYLTNGAEDAIEIIDLDTGDTNTVDLSTLPGFAGIQSIDVADGVIAVAIERASQTVGGVPTAQPGFVAFYDAAGNLLSTVDVGNLPDDVTFTTDGDTLLVAGEGENNVDSSHEADPIGTIAVVDAADPENPSANILDFTAFDGTEDTLRAEGVRIRDGVPFSQDAEPEYVVVSPDGSTAFVSLQENNAIAVVDLVTETITDVIPAGKVDHSADGFGLDPNDDGVIDIRTFQNLVGIRMPDGIAVAEVNGETFLFGANEGDGRGDVGDGPEADEARVEDIIAGDVPGLSIDPSVDTAGLERLTVSTVDGDTDGDGELETLNAFGSRSFTIWDTSGNVVFDSGADFERIIADLAPERFNDDDGDTDGDEDRSDNKGPEPEAIAVGEVEGETYAFVGLERDSGIMIYNVTDPDNAFFVDYLAPAFVDTAPAGSVARHAPEIIAFTPADETLTGNAQIAVSYEVSGTAIVYDIVPEFDSVSIPEIQGAGHVSPFQGETVRTRGIVTAVDFNGYYLQDPEGDGNEATSDALFVFTGNGVAPGLVSVGDEVIVEGEVSEFIPGGADTGNLSTTQIASSEARILSSGNALPAAELIGAANRLPPDETVISEDELPVNLQDVPGTFDPEEDAIDFFDSLEGMRVTVDNPVAVQALNRFDEFNVLADDGQTTSTPLNDRGGINLQADPDGRGDLNPERIQIAYDGFFDLVDEDAVPGDVSVGDKLTNITGVVDYSFGNYEVLVTEGFSVEEDNPLEPQTTALTGAPNRLTVATYNVLNVTGNTEGPQGDDQADPEGDDDAAQIEALAEQIVSNLGAPDIVALQEIQDDSGEDDDGTLGADGTLQAIVDAIAAAGGPTYAFASAEVDVDGETGGAPGSNIRNAFLWNPERTELTDLETLELGNGEGDPFFETRDPLIGTFTFNGREVTVINNHFSSRFGSTPIFGGPQPFVQAGEEAREAQALAVNARVDEILAQDPDANVVVLGDLNTFEFTDEITEDLQGVGDERVLENLINDVPEGERYTFNFEGNSQVLDHILATENLAARSEIDIVHTNVDFPDDVAASDHEPVLARFLIAPEGTLIGTFDDDTLEGTDEPSILAGVGGNDSLVGGRSDDTIGGGIGDDTLIGTAGNDRIYGGSGNDVIETDDGDDLGVGAAGDDTVNGRAGDDRLFGREGDDSIAGGAGNDRISGGAGNDLGRGGGGDDTMRGEDGDDTFFAGAGNDILVGGNGVDVLLGEGGDDTILGGADGDVLLGGGGTDIVVGGAGADQMSGDAGNDTLVGGAGDDSMGGAEGDDLVRGGVGDDNLAAGPGIDGLRGGEGADNFFLATGEGYAIVPDFEIGTDVFVLPGDLSFDDLTITEDAISVAEDNDEDVLVRFDGIGDELTADSFLNASDFAL